MATRRTRRADSPFDTLERTFALLVTGPRPLALDGTTVAGLPNRPIPLDELQARLLHPSTGFAARDAAVAALVALAQAHGGRWTVGLAGVLLPGLRAKVGPLTEAYPEKADDLEAQALASLLAAVARCEPDRPRLAAWLRWQARKGATRLVESEMAEPGRPGTQPVSAAPPRPWGHPDLVLARLVAEDVLDPVEAELISATRIGDTPLAEAARALGLDYWAAHKRRRRAELRTRRHLEGTDGSGDSKDSRGSDVQNPTEKGCSPCGGSPRRSRTERRPGKRRPQPDTRR